MMTREEMQECMDAGLHNDTWFDKQEALRHRKEGFKIWGIDQHTAKPYIVEVGFKTEEDALAEIKRCRKKGKWFVKEADRSDPDYYHDGEKGYYASMSDEQYDAYCDAHE